MSIIRDLANNFDALSTLSANADITVLDTDIGSTVQGYDADTAKLDVSQTFTAAQKFTQLRETYIEPAGTVIDCSAGTVFFKTISAPTTLTFSNPPPSGTAFGFTFLILTSGTQTITWPAGVKWPGGTAPTLTTTGYDAFTFVTADGGTSWFGFTSGQAFA